jgi:bifunctional enzyme CysN/CysC
VNTLAEEPARKLELNDITVCNIATTQPLAFEPYSNSRELGGFILVDRYTHATVAAGLIRHSLRRAQNVHRQSLSIDRQARETLNGHAGKVLWFTGLSGSGKSTIANALEVELHGRGLHTYILDGDNIRQGLNRDLGFTDTDRVENIRRIAEVAKLMMDAGLIVMTSFISPFRRERDLARELIGTDNFIEVFVDTPLAVCEQRDVKGLYRKARQGKIPNMTGVNSPYEAPLAADITLRTQETPLAESVRVLRERLESPD